MKTEDARFEAWLKFEAEYSHPSRQICFNAGFDAGRSSVLKDIVTKANDIERPMKPIVTGILHSCDCECHKQFIPVQEVHAT